MRPRFFALLLLSAAQVVNAHVWDCLSSQPGGISEFLFAFNPSWQKVVSADMYTLNKTDTVHYLARFSEADYGQGLQNAGLKGNRNKGNFTLESGDLSVNLPVDMPDAVEDLANDKFSETKSAVLTLVEGGNSRQFGCKLL